VQHIEAFCRDINADPLQFGLRAILIDNQSITDKHWLCAAPLAYWPIVTHYFAVKHGLFILVALTRMCGVRMSRRSVKVYAFNGRWYDRAGLQTMLLNSMIQVDIKLSFMLARRQRDGVVRHDLLHPYFANDSKLQFESHPANTEGKRSLNMISQFMERLECGPKKANKEILSDEVSGVLVTGEPMPVDIMQNNSFPLVVTRHSIKPSMDFLMDVAPDDAPVGILNWHRDRYQDEFESIDCHVQIVLAQRATRGRTLVEGSNFWPNHPASARINIDSGPAIAHAIGAHETAIIELPDAALGPNSPTTSSASSSSSSSSSAATKPSYKRKK
jgi:hypothetical protein